MAGQSPGGGQSATSGAGEAPPPPPVDPGPGQLSVDAPGAGNTATRGTPTGTAPPPWSPAQRAVPGTRIGRAWWLLALGAVALLLVLIFILENLRTTPASFLVLHWNIPLGVDLLLAALLGAAVTLLLGTARMFQLRRLAKRYSRNGRRPPQ